MITARDLRQLLNEVPGDARVMITFAGEDERFVSCITLEANRVLRFCDSDRHMSAAEKLLLIDA